MKIKIIGEQDIGKESTSKIDKCYCVTLGCKISNIKLVVRPAHIDIIFKRISIAIVAIIAISTLSSQSLFFHILAPWLWCY